MKRPKNFVSGQALVKIFGHLSMHAFTLYSPFLISNSGLPHNPIAIQHMGLEVNLFFNNP